MLNKKITMSALSIVTVVALVGGATFALFTDQATANDSTFASGTADLQIGLDTGSEGTVSFADSFAAPDFTNLAPGFTSNTDFWLKNNSSAAISLDVLADVTAVTETGGVNGVNNLGNNLLVKWNCDVDDNGSLAGNTASPEFSVNDWAAGGNANLGTLVSGNAIFCRMTARVASTVGNEIQGDSVQFDTVYDATQTPEPTPTVVPTP